MRFAELLIYQGRLVHQERVDLTRLDEAGLRAAGNVLTTLQITQPNGSQPGEDGMIRAALRTGRLFELRRGVAHLLQPVPPHVAAYERLRPDYIFSTAVSAKPPFLISMVMPEPIGEDSREEGQGELHMLARLLELSLYGAAEVPEEEQFETMRQMLDARPIVVSAFFGGLPDDRELVNEAVEFAKYLGGFILRRDLGVDAEEDEDEDEEEEDEWDAPEGTIPLHRITLERLAELNRRSGRLMMLQARGSQEQAREWDDWVESYRCSEEELFEQLLRHPNAPSVRATLMPGSEALWVEFPAGPYRFGSEFSAVSQYLIPRDAEPVPDITEYEE